MNLLKRVAPAAAIAAILSGPAQAAALPDQNNPIGDIALDMHLVVGRLAKLDTRQATQTTQKEAVDKLDALIEKLEQQCKACRGGASGANPTRPLDASRVIGGPGGIGKLHAELRDGKKWGELPPHERDRIMQSLTEGFPPHYQKILERYYRRLAEEKRPGEDVDEGETENVPATNAKPAAATAPSSAASGNQ